MTPAIGLPVALPTGPPTPETASPAQVFQQKEATLAAYLAAFAVVYYRQPRQPAKRAPAQLTATLHIETADTIPTCMKHLLYALLRTVSGYYFHQSAPPHYAFTDLEVG